jgi:peptidase M23-like protein
MAVFNLFLSTILLPVIGVVLLWRRPRRPFGPWLSTFLMAAGVVGFSLLVAPWGFFGVPVRIVLAVAFVAALVSSLRRRIPEEPVLETPVRAIVKVAIGFFFGGVAVGVLQAHEVPPGPVELRLPLEHGTYLAMHGGSTAAANIHFADGKQRYAVDFVKLNAAGFRARGLFPADPRAYAIFGASVVSPCDGSVASAVDGLADGVPDPKNPLGNRVVLRCGDALVTLAQLQRGSIAVKAGSTIAAGAPIGRAGNSGLSPEPHLHVHAERGGVGVGMTFGGRWLVRNAIVRE